MADTPARAAHWWMVVSGGEVDVCDYDPGYEVAVTVSAPLSALVRLWRGDDAWDQAIRSGAVRLYGPAAARRELPSWLGQMALATAAARV